MLLHEEYSASISISNKIFVSRNCWQLAFLLINYSFPQYSPLILLWNIFLDTYVAMFSHLHSQVHHLLLPAWIQSKLSLSSMEGKRCLNLTHCCTTQTKPYKRYKFWHFYVFHAKWPYARFAKTELVIMNNNKPGKLPIGSKNCIATANNIKLFKYDANGY